MAQPPHELFTTWRHSREEDEAGVEVYRPDGFDFPPARGRAGLIIGSDGTFIELPIGADDRTVSAPGTWQPSEDGARLNLTGEYEMAPTETIEIVELSSEVLKIRRLGPPEMW